MKNNASNPDEFDMLMADMNNDVQPSAEFKNILYNRMNISYHSSSIMLKLKSFFRNDLFVTGLGSIVILLFVFAFIYKPKISPIFTPGKTQQNTLAQKPNITFGAKRDDWVYKYTGEESRSIPIAGGGGGFSFSNLNKMGAPNVAMAPQMSAETDLGFSTGGAKDINNFRENIKNGYLPLPTDITYEGLFYDYFFDTGKQKECTDLFCPSYSYAVSKDPFSKENEYYMTVGLNSGIKANQFHRKNLNLIVVLDISGSMGSPFNSYYYDGKTQIGVKPSEEDRSRKKMQVANETIVAMLDHLQPQDRFGMVLFDGSAYEAKPLHYVGESNMSAIKKHILEITEQGSTNHEAGFTKGMDVFKNAKLPNDSSYENRIIFLTDAMPNTGSTDKNSLLGLVTQADRENVFTTFIGVGIDFNSELIESITKVRGANYYSVHSSSEFAKRMNEEFEFMVTPLVFDLSLDFKSQGWEIEKVYGSPDTGEQNRLMYVRTLFPSASSGGETKGGVVLLKLKKLGENNSSIQLTATYTDRSGKIFQSTQPVSIPSTTSEYYPNSGIHKAIVLTRYASLMKSFMLSKRASPTYHDEYIRIPEHGILPPDEKRYSEWERTSFPLELNPEDKVMFQQFKQYFEAEKKAINDPTMEQENEILQTLIQ